MKYKFIVLFLIFSASNVKGQEYNTIVRNAIYTSYFNCNYHVPILVVYKLFHGGGDCDRKNFHFVNDEDDIKTAEPLDYIGNGYDQGHMANAEDFAYDCTLDELTFRFYNCVPQTPNLNRGIYKSWEGKIRIESQTDSLLIICGNIFGKIKIGKDSIGVPDFCFKVVESLTTKNVTHVLFFINTTPASVKEESLSDLEEKIGYKIPLKK
jgi:DNA/RNA endonuclease G (NUC1)